uniref:Uncharacterized protein n=1 Tax=viral metagenome TaxID=1070528 RepID=A0A6M3M2Z6_9ZZZZ
MEGKFRERAKGVWCPLPRPEILVEDEFDARLTGKEIGEIAVNAKRATGWTNMFNACPACDYLEEFHLENVGVFCTYPNKLK